MHVLYLVSRLGSSPPPSEATDPADELGGVSSDDVDFPFPLFFFRCCLSDDGDGTPEEDSAVFPYFARSRAITERSSSILKGFVTTASIPACRYRSLSSSIAFAVRAMTMPS